ncbi:MAG: SlyX family protein [Gallionella sp.]
MNPEQNNERLENIETKIAYQEDMIEELNKTVYQQQQKLERLEATCESLAQHIATLYESASDGSKPENERPPHY